MNAGLLQQEIDRLKRYIATFPARPWLETDHPDVIACMGSAPACAAEACQHDKLQRQVDQLTADLSRLRDEKRMFPIQGGPDIPWSVIAPFESNAKANHDQTLARLAERGGLDCAEALDVLNGAKWSTCRLHGKAAIDALLARVAELQGLTGATLLARAEAAEQQIADALKVLDPNMPESGLVDACKQVKQVAISEADNSEQLERKLEAAEQRLRDQAQGWQPIATAPIDSSMSFLVLVGKDIAVAQQWIVNDDHRGWYARYTTLPIRPTHWMPLPASPEGQK